MRWEAGVTCLASQLRPIHPGSLQATNARARLPWHPGCPEGCSVPSLIPSDWKPSGHVQILSLLCRSGAVVWDRKVSTFSVCLSRFPSEGWQHFFYWKELGAIIIQWHLPGLYLLESSPLCPTPVLVPGRSHGRRSLVGCGPWDCWVGQDWVTSLSLFTFMHWRGKWQPTPVFLPGESQGRGSLVGCRLWGRTESDMTEVT